eukprot:2392104-Pyramimonas_sp.AAC.1
MDVGISVGQTAAIVDRIKTDAEKRADRWSRESRRESPRTSRQEGALENARGYQTDVDVGSARQPPRERWGQSGTAPNMKARGQ